MGNSLRSLSVLVIVAASSFWASCGGNEGETPFDAAPPDAQAVAAQRPALRIERVVSTEKADNVDAFCPPNRVLVGGGCECNKTAQFIWKAMPIAGKEGYHCQCLPLDGDPNGRLAVAHALCITSPESGIDLQQ